ncbi:MAG: phosphomannomutase/phosphoglucomutase [Bacteroidetes bacterium]|nr:phosphomannomutase/phosphoglucomutase [Bacteroidota bacterium]MBU1579985.1 phosphomannomutase/phosphoglucomutase [Bacteroidota bacterium]MBU2465078.1 phosphomannomutase/phosphoglucomutase [Bacteroidota bacterium]MBU2559016.1 phosphomannomutase/phosphoglucomutase [Bacteroidota bacterium]
MKAFKAYDIRGEWEKDLNAETAYRIGFFLPEVLRSGNFLVGRDCRLSSDELFDALAKGLTDAGATVTDAGLTSTPLIYWATARFEYDASVMITASHNPANHNGLKVSGKNALPIGYDNGLNRLEALVENDAINPVKEKGLIKKVDYRTVYLDFLKTYINDFSMLRIAVDCSNGMASLYIKDLLGNSAFYINDKADGNFPGHNPNPLEPSNQEQIKSMVTNRQCDIGLIFDGDADRVMFIDENGKFISPDLIIALLGHYFFEQKGLKGKVLQDIRSSKAIGEYLAQFGATVETWRVGRAYGAGKLREIDGLYGGELAGHYYFRDFYYSDSALLAALLVLDLLAGFKNAGFTLSNLIKNISGYHNSGEINFKIEQKQQAMDAVCAHFTKTEKPTQTLDFDGYRLDFDDWWFNIRPSNTEPYLRFIAEAKSAEKLDQVVEQLHKIIDSLNQ